MTREQYDGYNRKVLCALAAVNCYQCFYSALHYAQAEEAIDDARSYALFVTGDAMSDEVKITLHLRDTLTAAKRQHEEAERFADAAR